MYSHRTRYLWKILFTTDTIQQLKAVGSFLKSMVMNVYVGQHTRNLLKEI
jgi:hypothetical protein